MMTVSDPAYLGNVGDGAYKVQGQDTAPSSALGLPGFRPAMVTMTELSMNLTVRPLHPVFAAEIIGADLTVPPGPELVETVEQAMAAHAVTVVRDVRVSDSDHIRFARAFGPLELPPGLNRFDGVGARQIAPELFDVSNLDSDNQIIPYASERRRLARANRM